MNEKFADKFALGIIDADKRRPSYLNEFNEIVSSHHLKISKNELSNQDLRFRQLFKDLESFGEIKWSRIY